MNKEDLMKTLHDAGMADEEIKVLLKEMLSDLDNARDTAEGERKDAEDRAMDEDAEKKKAEQLLGVSL